MYRIRPVAALLTIGLAAALLGGCSNREGPVSGGPTSLETAALTTEQQELVDEINVLIGELFNNGGLKNAASKHLKNVADDLSKGKNDNAVKKAFELIDYLMKKKYDFGDPSVTDPACDGRNECAALTIQDILALVGIVDGGIPAEAFGDDGFIVTCLPGHDCQGGKQFGAHIPASLIGEPFVLFAYKLPSDVDPFDPFGFDGFPLFFDMGTIPEQNFGSSESSLQIAQVGDEAIGGVCVVDEGDFAPPEGTELQLAHIVGGEQVELLPERDAGFLDCSDVGDGGPFGEEEVSAWSRSFQTFIRPAFAALSPNRLYANPGKLGGAISSFSVFGAVDKNSEEQEDTYTYAYFDTEGTYLYDGDAISVIAEVSWDDGGTVDVGSVKFWVDPETGPSATESLDSEGTAEHEFTCNSTLGFGTHEVRVDYLGAGGFAPSMSETIEFSCNEIVID